MANITSNKAISDDEDDSLPLFLILLLYQRRRRPPIPSNRRWTSQEVVNDLLNCDSPTRIHSQLHMQLDTFYQLRD
jgi:hypothetical protein